MIIIESFINYLTLFNFSLKGVFIISVRYIRTIQEMKLFYFMKDFAYN